MVLLKFNNERKKQQHSSIVEISNLKCSSIVLSLNELSNYRKSRHLTLFVFLHAEKITPEISILDLIHSIFRSNFCNVSLIILLIKNFYMFQKPLLGHFKLAHQFWFSYPPPGAGGNSSSKFYFKIN